MRLRKSDGEIALMRHSADISSLAHIEAMKNGKPGIGEWQLQGLIEGCFRYLGASNWAYPSIVGCGENATILHYHENNKECKEGEVVLIDAGSEFEGYAADITRSWPVNGKFSDAQRKIYDLVLKSQLAAIEKCVVGNEYIDTHRAASKVLAEGLVELGIINCSPEEAIENGELKKYFESFSDSHLAKRVGNYTVSLTLEHLKKKVHGLIKFNNGKITYKETKNQNKANLIMRCPGHFVQEIIRNDLYWDELVSGFWCEFSRDPDIYNVAFWQLLHVPWRARKKDGKTNSRQIEIKTNTSIADIIEKGGSNVIEIFERNGLFCVGCDAAIGETIEEGCEIHGIDEKQRDKLILELGETVN